MGSRLAYLRTRVARRVFLLFVVGALVPVLFMAGAAFRAMSGQLREQSEERVRQVARNARQVVMQQLMLTESRIRLTAEAVRGERATPGDPVAGGVRRLMVQGRGGESRTILGTAFTPPPLGEDEEGHLEAGEMVLRVIPDSETPIVAGLRLSSSDGAEETLWAEVVGDSIWGTAERFASGGSIRDFCILVGPNPFYCRSGLSTTADAFLAAVTEPPASGSVAVSAADGDLVIGHAELFLGAAFGAPAIRVLVSEATEDLYTADLSLFRYSFAVALLLGLLLVVLLASIQVRRTMTPLEALTEGTHRLADGDLSARVPVESEDEFGALASSFNSMAGRLAVQFRTLEAGRAIDRAVLSDMDTDGVVDALLERFQALVSCRSMAVLVLRPRGDVAPELYWTGPGEGGRGRSGVTLSLEDRRWLAAESDHRIVEERGDRPTFLLDAPEALGPHPVVALPLRVQGRLLGAVLFEASGDEVPPPDIVGHARQVADQATVALDAVRLLGELEELNWGAIRALARAIDAKSRWTAGHSERVTELALALGESMGLSGGELEILERGGLLHDVGKIGVPAHVLDAEDPLRPEQWSIIREHPTIGGRILEPIRAFAPSLPIVLQHHERWDGRGYPAGLAGKEIHPLARIVAVADTYDAMASPRPYRRSMEPAVALAEIRRGSGTQFEPSVVEAFLEMMSRRSSGSVPAGIPEAGND